MVQRLMQKLLLDFMMVKKFTILKEGFGWDPIFIPNKYKETFAEISQETKNKISMRAKSS